MSGRTSTTPLPVPTCEPRGQAVGPFACTVATEQAGKRSAFTRACGKRNAAWIRGGGNARRGGEGGRGGGAVRSGDGRTHGERDRPGMAGGLVEQAGGHVEP